MNLPKEGQIKYLEEHELKNKSKRTISKHQASKKGYKHRVKLSKGESNTKLKIGVLRVSGLYLQKLPKYK